MYHGRQLGHRSLPISYGNGTHHVRSLRVPQACLLAPLLDSPSISVARLAWTRREQFDFSAPYRTESFYNVAGKASDDLKAWYPHPVSRLGCCYTKYLDGANTFQVLLRCSSRHVVYDSEVWPNNRCSKLKGPSRWLVFS